MASAVYLCNHSALEWANDCRAEGWPEATAHVHLNEGLVGRGRHWATDFWGLEAVGVEKGSVWVHFTHWKDGYTWRMFAWQLSASCAHRHKNRLLCHDMLRCRNMSDNSYHNEHIRHCSLHPWKATRPSSLWTTMNSTSKRWYGRKRADGSCFYLYIFHY